MSDDIRLDLLRDAICRSDLDGQTKDALADDLKYAQDINGTEDEALRGIKRLLISGVRRELLAHDRVARREAAEARAEADALLDEIKALGRKQKITPADVKAVAEKHEKQRGKPAPTKE